MKITIKKPSPKWLKYKDDEGKTAQTLTTRNH